MKSVSSNNGLNVKIEGGTPSEQRFVGAIVSGSLAKAGFQNTRHMVGANRSVDALAQAIMVPTMLDVIRQHSPDFLNTPVILSAYEPKPVKKERRSVDRVMERAMRAATSYDDSDVVERSLNARWNNLSIEEKEEALMHV